MKHCILVKWNEDVKDKKSIIPDIKALFDKLVELDGINKTEVIQCCTDRDNRYDIMIVVDMEKDKLECYDNSVVHKEWLRLYTPFIKSKAIFDY